MNRKIRKELKKLGYDKERYVPLTKASLRLFYQVTDHFSRKDLRDKKMKGVLDLL